MNQENFWVLVSKKLSGEATDSELHELAQLISENPEWQFAIQNLSDLWKHKAPNDDIQAQDAYMLHLHRMEELKISLTEESSVPTINNPTRKKWYWAAAAVLDRKSVV